MSHAANPKPSRGAAKFETAHQGMRTTPAAPRGASKVAKPHLLETSLAVDRHVAPSTQNHAKPVLLFLYRQVLGVELVSAEH